MKKLIIIAILSICSTCGYAQRNNNNGRAVTPKQQTTTASGNKSKAQQDAARRQAEAKRQEQARQDQLRKEQEEQERQQQLRREQEEQERIELERRNALRWDDTQKALCYNGQTYPVVFVKGNTFTMGEKYVHSGGKQGDRCDQPGARLSQVTLASFYIGKYEVTQELWEKVMGNNPSFVKGNRMPVTNISREACMQFLSKLSSQTGQLFRLPTEEQWEFAARGGVKSQGYKYSGSNSLNAVGWYSENSGGTIHEVGLKNPNELGIYDMSGNALEWCLGDYGLHRYGSQAWAWAYSTDPIARGGDCFHSPEFSSATKRDKQDTSKGRYAIGFRIVLVEE